MARGGKPIRRRSARPDVSEAAEKKAADGGWTEKLITALFMLVGLILCIVALVILWPESEASFRPHMEDYRRALSAAPKGPLTAEDKGGKILILDADLAKIDDVQTDLPEKLRARSPKDVTFVVRVKWKSQMVGMYTSKQGSRSPAVRWDCDVEVRHLESGRGTQTTVQGEAPPSFTTSYK